MFKRILVPLDGSKRAERALPIAARIARACGGTIVFVRVVLPPVEFGTFAVERGIALKPGAFEHELAQAERYLEDGMLTTYASDLQGIGAEMEVVAGAASPILFSVAGLENADLMVMCSHGESGLKRWVFGSVAREAVRQSPVPILVLNEHGLIPPESDTAHPLRVLVPLDGSPLSESVLEPTAELVAALAAPGQGAFHLVQFVLRPTTYGKFTSLANLDHFSVEQERQQAEAYLRALAERLHQGAFAQYHFAISWSVAVVTDIPEAILKLAGQPEGAESTDGYHLIAMATHGYSGLQRWAMGSITERVLHATKLPLLIVRPHDMLEKADQIQDQATTATIQ